MSIKFLGTGAGDYFVPSECNCSNCTGVRRMGGRNWRRPTGILVDEQILIDCGPQIFDSFKKYAVDISKIEDLLLTHSHEDHLDIPALTELASVRFSVSPLRVYGHASALQRLPDGLKAKLKLVPLGITEPIQINGWQIEGLAANHYIEENPQEIPLHYLFLRPDYQWFYGIDGCWFLKPAWIRLQRAKLDLLILDATLGFLTGDDRIFEHNNVAMVKEMVDAGKNAGILNGKKAKILLAHLSLHSNPPHDLLAPRIDKMGFMLAYDELELRF